VWIIDEDECLSELVLQGDCTPDIQPGSEAMAWGMPREAQCRDHMEDQCVPRERLVARILLRKGHVYAICPAPCDARTVSPIENSVVYKCGSPAEWLMWELVPARRIHDDELDSHLKCPQCAQCVRERCRPKRKHRAGMRAGSQDEGSDVGVKEGEQRSCKAFAPESHLAATQKHYPDEDHRAVESSFSGVLATLGTPKEAITATAQVSQCRGTKSEPL
jgi:hypothetical protein